MRRAPRLLTAWLTGSHGAVSVKSRATLELRSGVYYFESLTLEPDSVLRLNQAHGPVVVHVRNALVYRGKIAPNATLLLARVSAGPHRDIFAARRVELAASAVVRR